MSIPRYPVKIDPLIGVAGAPFRKPPGGSGGGSQGGTLGPLAGFLLLDMPFLPARRDAL